jgi:phospholipid/cholesterol/gamma-HCH transport system substrate-binding protein
MANAKSIEVKVGILILCALGILAGFVLLMGGLNFQPTYQLYVDFDNPGAVQGGVPVRIAGVKVGKVKEVQFRGGVVDPKTQKREPLVRLELSVERRAQSTIHDNAVFFVTSQGVLGEQFLAIDPGSLDRPVLAEGAVVRGLDPPRLDMLLAEGYELLHTTINAMRDNREDIRDAFNGMRDTLKGTGHFFNQNRDRLDHIAEGVDTTVQHADDLMRGAKSKYVDNPQIDRIVANVDRTAANLEPVVRDARETFANAKRASAAIGSEENAERVRRIVANVEAASGDVKTTAADARSVVAHVKKGDGSVGNLVMSEQLYDDLQELVRDLKHNPWKFFWKE